MKKNNLVMVLGMVAMLMIASNNLFATQKDSKAATFFVQDDDDERGSKIDLTDSEKYALKKPAKRAAGKGESRNENNAEMLARNAARASFAEAIKAAVLSASKTVYGEKNYFTEKESTEENTEGENNHFTSVSETEGGEKSNSIIKSVANEVIQNAPVVKKDKFYNKKRRRYTVYVCLEYDGEVKDMVEKVVKKMFQRIPKEDRQRIDENMEMFEFEIEKDLNKTKAENDEKNENDDDE